MAPSAPLPAPPTNSRKCSNQPNRHPPTTRQDPCSNFLYAVKELSEEDYDRYAEAYKTLDGILVTNLFTYYVEEAKSLASLRQEANKAFASHLLCR